mgnify:CR=1 FL=1
MRAPIPGGLCPGLRARLRPWLRLRLRLRFRGRGAEIAAGPPVVCGCGPGGALTSISLSILGAVRELITYPEGSSS